MRTDDDVNRAEKLLDNQTGNREDLETRLRCFGSEYKVVKHFTRLTGKIDRNLYFPWGNSFSFCTV